jgi:hypothetical protein
MVWWQLFWYYFNYFKKSWIVNIWLEIVIKKYHPLEHGVLFFAFYGTCAGGEGGQLKLYSFFEILDAHLNWILMWEGAKNSDKSQNSKKNCIKSFQCLEQISQEQRVFIISSKKLWLLYIYIFNIMLILN